MLNAYQKKIVMEPSQDLMVILRHIVVSNAGNLDVSNDDFAPRQKVKGVILPHTEGVNSP